MSRKNLPPSQRPHRRPAGDGSYLSLEERLVRTGCIIAGTAARKGVAPDQAEAKVMEAFRKAARGQAESQPFINQDGLEDFKVDAPMMLVMAMTDGPGLLKLPLDDLTAERYCAVIQRGLLDHRSRNYDWTLRP